MSVHVPPPHIRYLGPSTTDAASKKTTKSKSAPKAPKSKTTSSHPPYAVMIKKAIKTHGNAKGTSRAAILSYLLKNYTIGPNGTQINAKLRQALNRGITNGTLKQLKGNGANGSFGVVESKDAKPKTVKKSSKSKLPAKKTAAADKTKKATKPKKTTAAASPKAAAKPKTATKPKAKSPKKPKTSTKSGLKKTINKKKASPKKTKTTKKVPSKSA
ncbi:Linker histone H1 and H5 family protein [Aphelenchoides besseyi]|nr:Linker histone H1 and H5 family protein [Aphelenchoides besseyi]